MLELSREVATLEPACEPSMLELSREVATLEPACDVPSTAGLSLLKRFFRAPIALRIDCGAFLVGVTFIRRRCGSSS
jgi:hypothetical protein